VTTQTYSAVVLLLLIGGGSPGLAINPAEPGSLQVYVAVSPSPDYVKQWTRTPPSAPINITKLRELEVGKVAYVAFIVTGYTLTKNGETDLEVDCKIVNPDGSVLFDLPKYAKWHAHASARAFVMTDPALDLKIDPGDQLGRYRVLAVVRDLMSGVKASGEYSFEVKERPTTGSS
jgi:hypothetical protein